MRTQCGLNHSNGSLLCAPQAHSHLLLQRGYKEARHEKGQPDAAAECRDAVLCHRQQQVVVRDEDEPSCRGSDCVAKH